MSTLVIYASKTGNTKTFVDFIEKNLEVTVCNDYSVGIKDYNTIFFGSYSWGNGKIPKEMKEYLIKHQEDLKDKDVFIFGSGLSIYPRFCGAVDGINKIVSDCGANVLGTFKFEQRFIEKDYDIDDLLKKLTRKF